MPNWFTSTVFSKRRWRETVWPKVENTAFVQWLERTAWSKIKKNWLDLTAVGVFIGGSIFMAASIPAVTITITVLAIGTSIYLDVRHTQEKRALFDKRKRQIQLGDGTVIADPSEFEEKVKKRGLLLSIGAAIVYIGVASWNSWEAASSIWLEVFYGVDIFLAISSCHIGRKIYDMKLGAGLAVMEAELDKILDVSGLKNSDMARVQVGKIIQLEQLDIRYATLVDQVEQFLSVEEEKIRTQRVELSDLEPLRIAIRDTPSSTAQMFAIGLMDGTTREESSESPHVLSQLITYEVREDEREKPVP